MEKKIKSAAQLQVHFQETGSNVPTAVRRDLAQFEFGQLPDVTILTNFFIGEINYAIKIRQAEEKICGGLQKLCNQALPKTDLEAQIRSYLTKAVTELLAVGLQAQDIIHICIGELVTETASPTYAGAETSPVLIVLEKILRAVPDLVVEVEAATH